MATNDQLSVYSLLLASSGSVSSAVSERAIHESATGDLLIAYSLTTSMVWAGQHASATMDTGLGMFLSHLENELQIRDIQPQRVLTAETLRSWCDGLVRQELQTQAFTADDALRLRALIPTLVPLLPTGDEGEGLRLLFLQLMDSLDSFLIER